MKFYGLIKENLCAWRPAPKNNTLAAAILYAALVSLLVIKALWGYWLRDLTYGDTSYYFTSAVRWHQNGKVNIVWSPLYTAYYGFWLDITENASVATFLHRIGLIFTTTGLVAWLGYITLPRSLALLLACWWIALPIHYDTLYEMHLFGALPILVLALIALLASDRWKMPLLLGIAIITTFLVRNEFILVIGVLATLAVLNLLRNRQAISWPEMRLAGLRYGLVILLSGLLVAYFYSLSFIKSPDTKRIQTIKHTLNMCQVYAFGYQQRHPEWSANPWTECQSLMQEQFGALRPNLGKMVLTNPKAVARHFLWNLSLTRAGLEVLLFNATSAHDNPDYIPVFVTPALPDILLGLTLMIGIAGIVLIFRPGNHTQTRRKLARMGPLLLAVTVMTIAVIITQRPRPSYLLGLGVLYMWVVFIMLSTFMVRFKALNSLWLMGLFGALLLLIIPCYQALPLLSKNDRLGDVYNAARPQAARLCQSAGRLAMNQYALETVHYLCAPYNTNTDPDINEKGIVEMSALPTAAHSAPEKLVVALEAAGADAVIIDPFLLLRYPGLQNCAKLRDAFLNRGWLQLAYSINNDGSCIAAYAK